MNDILNEQKKQVGPLEKQSEVAKVYLRKKEELKSLDINVFLLENKRLREQLASAEEKYNLAMLDIDDFKQITSNTKVVFDGSKSFFFN